MNITAKQLADIYSIKEDVAAKWVDHLNKAMTKYLINTPARQAAFLAQVGHESGRLKYVKEIWNPKQCPWQAKYEGRKDLGNVVAGDGERYMGSGLIQITGRANYTQVAHDLNIDCVNHPELLRQPEYAALSAAWFWDSRKLNFYADKQDFITITKRINGGVNGLEDRQAIYEKAKKVLNV
jgi:putative chitinase